MRRDNRSLDYQKAIRESGAVLFGLERHQSKALLRDRMRFLRLLRSGECTSLAAAGRQIGLKLRASEKLWRKYREEGTQGLLDYPFKGSTGKLSGAQEQQLEEELHSARFQSLHQGCQYVEKTFGISYTPAGIRYVFQRLKVKKKTARPTHVQKDEAGEKRFKKKLPPPEAALQKAHLL
jgi:transposase